MRTASVSSSSTASTTRRRREFPRSDAEKLLCSRISCPYERELASLMREHGPSVLRLARSYLGDAHQAEDVFQDVFLRTYRSASSLRDRGAVRTWLLSVTANRCRDLLRSWGRRSVVPTAELPDLPHHDDVDDADVELVEAVLSLPLPFREVVFLHYYEGLSPAEIGKVLGVPMVTVRTRLHRARHALRSRLAEGVLADA